MTSCRWVPVVLATALGLGSLPLAIAPFTAPAQAVRLSDGKVYFIRPPRLIASSASQTLAYFSGSTYFFTLDVPADAGEPLQRVAIAQRHGNAATRRIVYDPENTRAFLGTRRDRGTPLTLTTRFDRDSSTLTADFSPPIPPGNTVTIAVRVDQNPPTGGVYLFGITAFPAGEPVHGQFLGYGRMQFDDPEGFPFFWH